MRSLETLLPKLLDATERGQLAWQKHKFAGFESKIKNFTLRIWEWTDENSPELTGVTIRLDGPDQSTYDEVVRDEFSPGLPQLRQLHAAARRVAFNVDSVIADLEKELIDPLS